MSASDSDRLLELARRQGLIRAGEIARAGIHSQAVTRLVRGGRLDRVSRGLYQVTGRAVTEHHGLVLAARAAPRGVVCLLSALSFHGIGTEVPFEVWLAIDRRARAPLLGQLPLRVVRFSGGALTEGVETHRIEGQPVRVYSVAKTLADVFKYRHKVGLAVALEALREAWRDRRFTMAALTRHARTCRVERVMRPYLELLVG